MRPSFRSAKAVAIVRVFERRSRKPSGRPAPTIFWAAGGKICISFLLPVLLFFLVPSRKRTRFLKLFSRECVAQGHSHRICRRRILRLRRRRYLYLPFLAPAHFYVPEGVRISTHKLPHTHVYIYAYACTDIRAFAEVTGGQRSALGTNKREKCGASSVGDGEMRRLDVTGGAVCSRLS